MAETAATAEKLAQVLDEHDLGELAARARANEFHDFLSQHVFPEMVLAAELEKAGHPALRQRVVDGEFDASREESQAWAASEDGRATLVELGPGVADAMGMAPDDSRRQDIEAAKEDR